MENFTENFGWLEIAFFYGIAISVCFWQWWKMRKEVREMRAEREAREAKEREDGAEERENSNKEDVRPELVGGPYFLLKEREPPKKKGRCFDKLSTNGFGF